MQSKEELVFSQVSRLIKPEYSALLGKLTSQMVIDDISDRFYRTEGIFNELGISELLFDIDAYKGLSDYAISGDCSYLLTEKGKAVTLYEQLHRCGGLQELFGAFEEFDTSPGQSAPFLMMMNMVSPRVAIDIARLGANDKQYISLVELSLLSGMKDGTVRNCAVSGKANSFETHKSDEGNTFVEANEAHRWLSERRRYVPTTLPLKQSEQEALIRQLLTIDE